MSSFQRSALLCEGLRLCFALVLVLRLWIIPHLRCSLANHLSFHSCCILSPVWSDFFKHYFPSTSVGRDSYTFLKQAHSDAVFLTPNNRTPDKNTPLYPSQTKRVSSFIYLFLKAQNYMVLLPPWRETVLLSSFLPQTGQRSWSATELQGLTGPQTIERSRCLPSVSPLCNHNMQNEDRDAERGSTACVVFNMYSAQMEIKCRSCGCRGELSKRPDPQNKDTKCREPAGKEFHNSVDSNTQERKC